MGPNISGRADVSDRFPLAPPPPVGGQPFSLSVEQVGTTLYLRLAGEFDAAHIGRVEAELARISESRTSRVVFDLQAVGFLDSTALTTILRAHERARFAAYDVVVVRPRGFADRIFTLTRAGEELKLVDQLSQAWSGERSQPRPA